MSEVMRAPTARREAIRLAIEAEPTATNTAIAKRMNAARDTVIAVRRQMAGQAITSRYDTMCTAIAECAAVDEVKDIRDKAMALEVYARQAQNFEAERTAQEIRVRAENRAGDLLKGRQAAPRGGDRKSNDYQRSQEKTFDCEPHPDSLQAIGITKQQASQWRQLAEVPRETFEAAIADKDEPLSATRIIERHRAATQPAPEPVPAEPVQKVDKRAIHLWGALRDLAAWLGANDVQSIMQVMPPYLLDDVLENAPLVIAQLSKIGDGNE